MKPVNPGKYRQLMVTLKTRNSNEKSLDWQLTETSLISNETQVRTEILEEKKTLIGLGKKRRDGE